MRLTRLLPALLMLIPTFGLAQVEEDWVLSDIPWGSGWKASQRHGAFEVSLRYLPNLEPQWELILSHPEPIGVGPTDIPSSYFPYASYVFAERDGRYPNEFTSKLVESGLIHQANPDAVVSLDEFSLYDEYGLEILSLWPEVCEVNCVFPQASIETVLVIIPLTLDDVMVFKDAQYGQIWYKKAKNLQGLSDTDFRYEFPLFNYEDADVNTDAIDTLIRIATEPGFEPDLGDDQDDYSDEDFFEEMAEEAGLFEEITAQMILPSGNLALCAQAEGVAVLQNLLDQAVADDAPPSYLSIIAKGAAAEGCSVLTAHAPIAINVTDERPNELQINAAILDGWISRRIATPASQ